MRVGGKYDEADAGERKREKKQKKQKKSGKGLALAADESATKPAVSPLPRSGSLEALSPAAPPGAASPDTDYKDMLATYKKQKAASEALSPRSVLGELEAGERPEAAKNWARFVAGDLRMRVTVVNGVNFPPCSPWVMLRYGSQKRATKVIIKTGTERAWDAEPEWNETASFTYEPGANLLFADCWTKAGTGDKSLGSAKVDLESFAAWGLKKQFLLAANILEDHEAAASLRCVVLNIDLTPPAEVEVKKRLDTLSRASGSALNDTVRLSAGKGSRIAVARKGTEPPLPGAMCDGADSSPPDMAKILAYLRTHEDAQAQTCNSNGQTYLQLVCTTENPDLVTSLLKKGSAVDHQDLEGLTPLHTASSYCHLETARALLAAGANVSLTDALGNTPLHLAALNGHEALVRLLLSAKGVNVKATDEQGLTPLHKAAHAGSRVCCELLADAGAPINAVDNSGASPLLLAEMAGKYDAADYLLTKGADYLLQTRSGDSVLWAACLRGDTKRLLRYIQQFKVNSNTKFAPHGQTLLHRIALQLDEPLCVQLVTFLLQHGVDPNAKNDEEKTPIFAAVWKAYPQMAKLLLYAGASATAVDKNGNTPLHFARTTEVAKLLVHRGAKANVKNKQGNTPMHSAFAFFSKDKELVDYLLSKAAGDLTAKNLRGATPPEVLNTLLVRKIVMPVLPEDESMPDCGGLYIASSPTPSSPKLI